MRYPRRKRPRSATSTLFLISCPNSPILAATPALDVRGKPLWGQTSPLPERPANIIVRGVVDYSPIGMIRGFGNLLTDVKRGDMTAGEAVDQISGGLVGTALLGLGALLSHLGYVTGGESDDEQQQALDELRGVQPYSLQIGGNSYTLDWLAPERASLLYRRRNTKALWRQRQRQLLRTPASDRRHSRPDA